MAASGWIETEKVTALVGTNEAGKTNLLLPLWKLNPAKEGVIDPTADYPRKRYTPIRGMAEKPIFIRAVFSDNGLAGEVATLTGLPAEQLREVEVAKDFDDEIHVSFPKAKPPRSIGRDVLLKVAQEATDQVKLLEPLKSETDLKANVLAGLVDLVPAGRDGQVPRDDLDRMIVAVREFIREDAPKTSRHRAGGRHRDRRALEPEPRVWRRRPLTPDGSAVAVRRPFFLLNVPVGIAMAPAAGHPIAGRGMGRYHGSAARTGHDHRGHSRDEETRRTQRRATRNVP